SNSCKFEAERSTASYQEHTSAQLSLEGQPGHPDKKRRILLQPTKGHHSARERGYTLTMRCSLVVLRPSSS
ncbi:hypothetical protein LEMLEM_LOCUS14161, partial [Lemmus lemmus]